MSRKKTNSRDTVYRDRNTKPSRQTGNTNSRNNNQDVDAPGVPANEEPNIQENNTGIGDSTWNRDKLTNYTSNHSADA